jgi:hypothetical protein
MHPPVRALGRRGGPAFEFGLFAQSEPWPAGTRRWLPSHRGARAVCLHMQRA